MARPAALALAALATAALATAVAAALTGSAALAAGRPAALAAGRPAALSLAGNWRVVDEYDPTSKALPASLRTIPIPSNWYRHGWDRDGVLWFVREVEVPREASWRVEIGGCDYRCDVYWDGQLAGSHTGYFAPFALPIASGRGKHVLAVKVDSPRETARDWSLDKTLIKGVLSHHDTRPGGAWSVEGQDANTGGLWGDVRLASADTAWIDELRVVTTKLGATSAELRITGKVTPLRAAPLALEWKIAGPGGKTAAAATWVPTGVTPGAPISLDITTSIADPQLWWPRDLGAVALYQLSLGAVGPAGTDEQTLRFGIRTLERDSQDRYLINGVPVFLRGTNYIGSIYLSSLTRAVVQKDLELMLRANINAVRVHAHVTAPVFYDLADELGLLVWQDFPLQWGYDDSAAFAAEAARQLREMIALLGGHPSVIHWTGQNESPWSSEWMVYKYPLYDPDQNRRLSAALSPVLAADPDHPSQVNSGSAEHAWMGWYSGTYKEFAKPQQHAVLTEYGAQALPQLTTLSKILRPEQLWPLDKNLGAWQYHNFQKHELVNIAKVPIGATVNALIANTQKYQASLIQFAAENLRRQAWAPITGIFQFMFNEHWPSMSWGVVDYLRNPKPGYEALRRAYQPLLPIAYPYKKGSLRLHVVNDRSKPEDVIIVLTRELDGKVTYRRRLEQRVSPSSVTSVEGELERPTASEALRIVITDRRRNTQLSENYYAPGFFAE